MRRSRYVGALGVTLLTTALAPSSAEGQALIILLFGDKLSTESFQLGINADLTWTGVSSADGSSTRSSWAFGAYGQVRLSEDWSLMPELTIKTPAGMSEIGVGQAGNPFAPTGDPEVDAVLVGATVKRELNYVTMPISLRYAPGRWGLSAGGYFGYMTGGSDVLESDVGQGFLTLEDDQIPDLLQRWDVGLQAGIDFALKPERDMRSVRINVKGVYGLVNTVPDAIGTSHRNFGIFFGLDIPVGGPGAVEDEAGTE